MRGRLRLGAPGLALALRHHRSEHARRGDAEAGREGPSAPGGRRLTLKWASRLPLVKALALAATAQLMRMGRWKCGYEARPASHPGVPSRGLVGRVSTARAVKTPRPSDRLLPHSESPGGCGGFELSRSVAIEVTRGALSGPSTPITPRNCAASPRSRRSLMRSKAVRRSPKVAGRPFAFPGRGGAGAVKALAPFPG